MSRLSRWMVQNREFIETLLIGAVAIAAFE